MPEILWLPGAFIFNRIEHKGVWPDALLHIPIAWIPKGMGGAPCDQRPISLASGIYAAWSSARFSQTKDWQDLILPNFLHGGIRGRGAVESEWDFGIDLETSRALQESLIGALLDRKKCFD